MVVQCQCGTAVNTQDSNHASQAICPKCGRMLNLLNRPLRLAAQLRGHRAPVLCSAFSPDGRLLATCGGADANTEAPRLAEIRLWDMAKKRIAAAMQGHQDAVQCVAFSPDGETLVTGSADHTLVVWNVSRGMHDVVMGLKEHTLKGHTAAVTSAVFSHDGTRLFTASDDGELRIWDSAHWRCLRAVATGRSGDFRLDRSTNGAFLAGISRSPGPAMIWSTKSWEEHVRLVLRPEELSEDFDLAFSPDSNFLAVLSASLLRIWDLSSCQVAVAIDASGYQRCAYSPDGRVLATAGAEIRTRYEVQLWDVVTGDQLGALSGQHEALNTVCFSPRGNRLAYAGRDSLVHVWEI